MNIKDTLTAYVKEYDALARTLYPAYARHPMPVIEFFDNGRANGLAHAGRWEVQFNITAAELIGEAFRNTVSHEIAHLVEYAIDGKISHSPNWKNIHRSLGGTGAARSSYAVQVPNRRKRVKTEHLYRNANGAECWIGPRYHGRFVRGELISVRNRTGETFKASHYTNRTRQIT